jgi:hypothetical protein
MIGLGYREGVYNKVEVTFGAIPSIGTIISYHLFIFAKLNEVLGSPRASLRGPKI